MVMDNNTPLYIMCDYYIIRDNDSFYKSSLALNNPFHPPLYIPYDYYIFPFLHYYRQ